MILLTAKQALLRHEASVLAYERSEREKAAQKKKEGLIPKGVIIEDNGISAKVIEHLVIAEKLSRDNSRFLDEEKIYKLIKELISL